MNDIAYGFISGAGIAIIVVAVVLYLKWIFIRSAVKSGVIQAIEYYNKRDNINGNEPQSPKSLDNSFEKDLHGWISFEK